MSVNDATRPATRAVIQLAERAPEIIEITELESNNGVFVGKHINLDGSITAYPKTVAWWQQRVAPVPATIPHLFAYLHAARTRNICLIRGSPADVDRQPTRRRLAGLVGGRDRRDHGFLNLPTRLLPIDVDGAKMAWKADTEGAVRRIVAQLGEPWASTSLVWFFSATHGLEFDEHKRWTGRLSDSVVRVRLVFIADRALDEAEAVALTRIAKAHSGLPLDESIVRCVQPNYIKRPHWVEHPGRDVLGDLPTIGWIRGDKDYLTVPDDLSYTARWASAQGHHVDIADHPDAETAVRGIGSDGAVRSHLMSAVQHLLLANPVPEVVSFLDHAKAIVGALSGMVEQHRAEIENNLAAYKRGWGDVLQYLPDNMTDWAVWLLDHPGALKRKTIKLTREEAPSNAKTGADVGGESADAEAEAIYARVARTIEQARRGETDNPYQAHLNEETPPVVLLVAPTGSRKSTLMRTAAVKYLEEHPTKTVVILVPYHNLSDEQLDRLREDHPDVTAAVWRGRQRDDPEEPDPKHPGKLRKMCWRADEAKEVEAAMLDVGSHLCKQGRGAEAIKCPFFDQCGYQRQKAIEARIWFAAHEVMVHKMPKAFGNVGWVLIDESPLDAFMLGVDSNDPVELALDALREPVPSGLNELEQLMLEHGRSDLHRGLDKLMVPIDRHRGAPVTYVAMYMFDHTRWTRSARQMRALEWKGKVMPKIRPDMSPAQVRKLLKTAEGNGVVAVRALLWWLVEEALDAMDRSVRKEIQERTSGEMIWVNTFVATVWGTIQLHRGEAGRVIRMVGQRRIAKGWGVQTLICDATGNAELLRVIWPNLEEPEPHGWEQLPRPENVRIFQCVDRSKSKWDVAVEGKNPKEMARKVKSARELYGSVLAKALQYGGQDVGLITYKSTEESIRKNCFVPPWLKVFHFGALVGSNALATVRALFVVGRPLASTEAVTRQAEALFGHYIGGRDYRKRSKGGRIPIVPDAKGKNTIWVDAWEHPDPRAELLRRQVTEAAIIQAVGRARAGLRKAGEPLDVHLWTDVPVPELGPVVPVLWHEVDAGLDGAMLADGGMWLETIRDAAQAYRGLFTADGLKSARKGRRNPISKTPCLVSIRYQRAGAGQRPARGLALLDPPAARAWLEARLGPLVRFDVEAGDSPATEGQVG
jgi:putative DNA primase/helicase